MEKLVKKKSSMWSGLSIGNIGSLVTGGLFSGALFGFALEKGKVHLPLMIRNQMLFTDPNNSMMKMFLTALATTTLLLIPVRSYISRRNIKSIDLTPKGNIPLALGKIQYGNNILGGLLIGIGMTISGTCPGTIFAQIGGGVPNAIYSFSGAIVGALLYSIIDTVSKKQFPTFGSTADNKSLDSMLGFSKNTVSLELGLFVAGVVGVLSYSDIKSSNIFQLSLKDTQWHPIVSGMLIGLSQLSSLFFSGMLVGFSSSWVTFLSCSLSSTCYPVYQRLPYLDRFKSSPRDLWMISLAVGSVLGSYLSSSLSGYVVPGAMYSVTREESFIGAIIILIGARLAGGCTSGHGISGVSGLSIASVYTTAAMFAGGIGFANLFYR